MLRGVVARIPIESGEELCAVPRPCCLDLSVAEGSGSPCTEFVPTPLWLELRWFERLALWLLAEQKRGGGSIVSGYIGYLPPPESFSDFTLEWSDEELAELRYPPVIVAVKEQAAELAELHAKLRGCAPAFGADVTEKELRWAHQLVLSRAFTSDIAKLEEPAPPPPPQGFAAATVSSATEGAKTWLSNLPGVGSLVGEKKELLNSQLCMAMMPMLDAFNHKSNAETVCEFDFERNSFVLTSPVPLKQGAPITLSYGKKSNDELLQLFGFVELNNPYENFLSIGFDEHLASLGGSAFASPREMQSRFEIIGKMGLDGALTTELAGSGAPVPTMHALRVLFGTAAELDGDLQRLVKPASLETELRCWSALQGYCKAARNYMGGARGADLSEAGRIEASEPRRALALKFRAEKKRVLSELEQRVKLLAARSRKEGRVMS